MKALWKQESERKRLTKPVFKMLLREDHLVGCCTAQSQTPTDVSEVLLQSIIMEVTLMISSVFLDDAQHPKVYRQTPK
jgi:hypothetical protein